MNKSSRRRFISSAVGGVAGSSVGLPFIVGRARWDARAALLAGGVVEVPAGSHVVEGGRVVVRVGGGRFGLVGPGSSLASLTFPDGGGLRVEGGPQGAVQVSGVSLLTSEKRAGDALDFGFDRVQSSTARNVSVSDVQLRGKGGGWWTGGLRVSNGWASQVDRLVVSAVSGRMAPRFGVRFEGQSTVPTLDRVQIHNVREAVQLVGESEGLRVLHSDFVACRAGVSVSGAPHLPPHVMVDDCHMNVTEVGVRARDRSQVWVRDSLIYRLPRGGSPFVGVDARRCIDVDVSGIKVFGIRDHLALPLSAGVRVDDAANCVTSGSTFDNLSVGVAGGSSGVGNVFRGVGVDVA